MSFEAPFAEGTKRSQEEPYLDCRVVGTVLPHCTWPVHPLLSPSQLAMLTRSIVVMHPGICNLTSDAADPNPQTLMHKIYIHCLSNRHRLLVDHTFCIKEDNEHQFHTWFVHWRPFLTEEARVCHSALCLLVLSQNCTRKSKFCHQLSLCPKDLGQSPNIQIVHDKLSHASCVHFRSYTV